MSLKNDYSALDQMMHRLAFSGAGGQIAMAALEDQLYAADLDPIEICQPVFITALPRAGTTILLNSLASLDEFATHSYRYMPFVLCPLLWSKVSSKFRVNIEQRERAHGDGLSVDVDSPEAFEEMLWVPFWKQHYKPDRIQIWQQSDREFFDFLRSHMKKVINLTRRSGANALRYISKNNLNIARIEILSREFHDAILLVPFREPLQHAASLLNQHRNFLKLHKNDKFARRYMAGVGHFDFGENLRPVDFDSWIDQSDFRDPQTIEFWLEYWIAAYGHLSNLGQAQFVCFEDLCKRPDFSLDKLGQILDINDCKSLMLMASTFRPALERTVTIDPKFEFLVSKSRHLYQSLREQAVNLIAD